MLEMDEIDMIVVGAPNVFHYSIAVDSAAAGKHVVMEKPFCLNLQEAALVLINFGETSVAFKNQTECKQFLFVG